MSFLFVVFSILLLSCMVCCISVADNGSQECVCAFSTIDDLLHVTMSSPFCCLVHSSQYSTGIDGRSLIPSLPLDSNHSKYRKYC